MQEKDQRTSMSGSKEADLVSVLSSQLRNHSPPISSIEDPEIHWGLETRTTLNLSTYRHMYRERIYKLEAMNIIGTNLLTKFHEDWKINVASRVLTRKNAPPPGSHVFQQTGIIF
ncbi:hypothetical protein DPMN_001080 [Dreissena polymorpha]|uniref:Uncharacterized protein n=1 Tax=Dreissena polymorpha TaxID=45954 RepID=A0A9D4MHW4_DREPO|nr:hypothetical protein DPMN_001080 [Dreissena polymorpha]